MHAILRHLAIAFGLWAVTAAGPGFAQALPNGTVKLIVPYAPGGPIDLLTRILGERLPTRLSRTVIVDNKPGAGGNLAAQMVATAPPDGLTLLAAGDTTFTVSPFMFKQLPYDSEKDFRAITLLGTYTLMLAAHPRLPVKTVKDLVALSKTKPLNFATGGNGAPGHLGFEYLRLATGMQGQTIPYKGGAPAAAALLAGEVDAAFLSTSVVVPMAKGNRVIALASADLTRYAGMPEIPTIAESGYPGFQIVFSYLMLAPAATPVPILQQLNREIRAILDNDEMRGRLAATGIDVKLTSLDESAAWLKTERTRWQGVIRDSKMKVE